MKKVLVTGGSGFLGKGLVKRLEENGVEVLALNSRNANLTDDKSLAQAVANPESFDHIFHLAAWTQAGTFCDTHRGIQWIVNQQINTNVLAWWQKYAPQAKMITFGTSVSYSTETGLSEEKYLDGIPTDKFYAYAMCKRMLLAGLQCLKRQYGMDYLYLVPSTIYGPGYHMDGRQFHFIYDLIIKIIKGKMYGSPVTLWGDGEQRRELIFIDDFIDCMLGLNKTSANEIFNVGSGDDHSIKDFARVICDIVGYDFNRIGFDETKYVGARSKVLEIGKMESRFNESPLNVSLKEGIAQTINWVMENEQTLLKN